MMIWSKMKVTEFRCTVCGAVMKLLPGETAECTNIGWADREVVE